MNIEILNDQISLIGHAETVEECETISLFCEALENSKDFKTIEYKNGYANFKLDNGVHK